MYSIFTCDENDVKNLLSSLLRIEIVRRVLEKETAVSTMNLDARRKREEPPELESQLVLRVPEVRTAFLPFLAF